MGSRGIQREMVGNGLVIVMFIKPVDLSEVRDLVHIYFTNSGCSDNRKFQYLTSGIHTTEMCLCHFDDCQNCITPDSDSDDDE